MQIYRGKNVEGRIIEGKDNNWCVVRLGDLLEELEHVNCQVYREG